MHLSLDNPILLLITQVGLILLASRAIGWLFARFHQPQVMGEMVAGIMLGPSLFGLLWPAAHAAVFPPDTVPLLNVLSQVGVIFFLFLIGLELDPKLLRNQGHAAVVISHASIVAPFLLGAALALYLYPRLFNDAPTMGFVPVALFMGAAMSITAFPVLARILTERNLHKTKVGAVTITCAAVDDVTAWCMLAFVVGVARAEGLVPAMVTAALSGVYVAVMFFAVRPFLKRLLGPFERERRLSQNIVALILGLTLASAWVTEAIGIHALFGAFLMGAIMPKGVQFVRMLSEKLEDYIVVFLLPIFFAYTGLKTEIGLLNSPELWLMTLLVIAVACAGKFGGSAVAARACGLGWREASAIGILMNTRGLMELVILNIGRELGVITPAVFAMMVLMAVVTTFMTTPVLRAVYPSRLYESAKMAPAARRGYSVLVPVADPKSGVPMVRLADALTRAAADRVVYALHLTRPFDRDAYRSGIALRQAGAVREGSTALPGVEPDAALQPVLSFARERGVPVEPISFVTRDAASDIARVVRAREVDLVLMGYHKPVFGGSMLGGTVHRVMTGAEADVAVFVDRGSPESPARILVPFMGGRHDRLALKLASRLARSCNAYVTVLHVPRARRRGRRADGAPRAGGDRASVQRPGPAQAGRGPRREGGVAGRRGAARRRGVRPGGDRRLGGVGPGVPPVRPAPGAHRGAVAHVTPHRPRARGNRAAGRVAAPHRRGPRR
jgi:Kef-type K+ transport system membrane component KefB/nucleotide-binding universal stress UspA family protein